VIECVPNVSEGRRRPVIDALVDAVSGVPGVRVLDCSSDASHNRSVLTMAGEPEPVARAVLALVERAVTTIDLRVHRGEHPRVGAVDVVPFVPLAGHDMTDCVTTARDVGATIARRFDVPVFLYEHAARGSDRRRLEVIRRGDLEGLAARMRLPEWAPDYGPAALHPSAGAIIVGARGPLIAFNVNLATDRLDVARRIAAVVRESGGGLPAVKAMAVRLDRGTVQVSMNLVDYERTPMLTAFAAVRQEAERLGVAVADSELVGLAPAAALTADQAATMRIRDFSPNCILEHRLGQVRSC
jgi:glutamate formiminotransferase